MEYEVLIIGSRIAGASLALLLGKLGRRVLMVDRDRFPSDTLSTHVVLPQGVSLLADLGVLEDVEAVGFRRITRSRTYIEDCFFEGPIGPPGVYYLVPRRANLDAILIKHATRQASVEFLPQTPVEGLIQEGDRVVGAVVRTPDGERREIRASVVVGADGKDSQVAKWMKAPTYDEVPALRPVYYGYYRGVIPLPEPALELFFVRDRIGFLFPMQPDTDCLILELQPEDFGAFRANPKTMFEETFRALPFMAPRIKDAVLEGQIRGTRGVPNWFRKPFGPGWVLTGDAGHVKDSSTGFGIRDALIQSFLLADVLDAILNGADWEASLSEFESKRNHIMLPSFQATVRYTQLHDLPSEKLAWFRGILANPHLCRSFMQSVAGSLPDESPAPLQKEIRSMGKLFGGEQTS
jgi:flavin-dependent dehydrogenase